MRTKRLITFAVLAAVVGGAGFLVTRPAPSKPLTLAEAATATVRAEVTAMGSIQPARVVALSFTGSGRIGEVTVTPGDAVSGGQLLGSLDPAAARLDVSARETALRLAEQKLAAVKTSGGLDWRANRAQTEQAVVVASSNRTLASVARDVRAASRDAASIRLATAEEQAANDATIRDNDRSRLTAAQTKLDALTAKRDEARTGFESAKATTAAANIRRDEARATVEASRIPLTRLTLARDEARRVLEKATADLERSRALNADAIANGVFVSDNLVVAARDRFNAADREVTTQELVVGDLQRAYDMTLTTAAQAETNQANAQGRLDLADANVTAQTSNVESLQRILEGSTETARRSLENIGVVRRSNDAESARDSQAVKQSDLAAKQAEAAAQLTQRQAALRDTGTRPVEMLGVNAEVDAAAKALDQARERLQQLAILAPFDGIVSAVSVKVGELAGSATPVPGVAPSGTTGAAAAFTLIDASSLSVRAGFPDVDLTRIAVGQRSIVRFDALPGVEVTGKVAAIEPSPTIVNNVSTTYVRMSLDDRPKGLRTGMAATVRVVVGETPNALVVPAAALSENAGVLSVRRATPRKSRSAIEKTTTANTDIVDAIVTIGDRSDGNVQVVSGLAAGDLVVVPESGVAK